MKKIIIGNLKMNLQSIKERDVYLAQMSDELKKKKIDNMEIVLCPPFVHLEGFKKWKNKRVKRGAQNSFWEEKGSFTGEISPVMLKNFGCEYVIVGHSERRRYFRESGEETNYKMQAVLKRGIHPILCIGESKEEKERMLEVVSKQLRESLRDMSIADMKKSIIAYEPVWSVGTDVLPSTNEVMSANLLIRKILQEIFGGKIAEEVLIVYGGSVNSKNVKSVCLDANMNGVLVGRESLDPFEFVKIAEEINSYNI